MRRSPHRRPAATPARASLVLAAFAALALAAAPGVAEESVLDIAGIYDVEGETTVEGSPDRFHIEGKLVINQNGRNCSTKFEGGFKRVTGDSGPASFSMIGLGDATLDGRHFSGMTETQTIVSEVTGVDVNAAFMPKKFGPKLISRSDGKVEDDGTIIVEITSDVIGEGFTLPEGRKTILRATRVARSATELKSKGRRQASTSP